MLNRERKGRCQVKKKEFYPKSMSRSSRSRDFLLQFYFQILSLLFFFPFILAVWEKPSSKKAITTRAHQVVIVCIGWWLGALLLMRWHYNSWKEKKERTRSQLHVVSEAIFTTQLYRIDFRSFSLETWQQEREKEWKKCKRRCISHRKGLQQQEKKRKGITISSQPHHQLIRDHRNEKLKKKQENH